MGGDAGAAGMGGDAGAAGMGGDAGAGGGQVVSAYCPLKNPYNAEAEGGVTVNETILGKDTVWEGNKVYVVLVNLEVDDGHSLTIEAGATVCFADGKSISVGSLNGGTLKVMGTADKRVTFTSAEATPETPHYWAGIRLNTTPGTEFHHAGPFRGFLTCKSDPLLEQPT
jgi:hypothetical protein